MRVDFWNPQMGWEQADFNKETDKQKKTDRKISVMKPKTIKLKGMNI
jgi:hypothetical protein